MQNNVCAHSIRALIALCLSMLLTSAYPSMAFSALRCKDTLLNVSQKFRYLTLEGGFTEINPWLAEWDGSAAVRTDATDESVRISTRQSKATASMHFQKDWQMELKNVGRGLGIKLEAMTSKATVELRIRGFSDIYNEPFSAVATLTPEFGSQTILIPWENFKLENRVRNGWAKAVGNGHYPERHKGKSSFSGDPLVVYEAGDSFYPAAFHIRGFDFTISANTTISINGPIFRDFPIQWLQQKPLEFMIANGFYNVVGSHLAHVLPERAIDIYLDQIQRPEAQKYAFETVAKGEDAVKTELAKYDVRTKELSGKEDSYSFFGGTFEDEGSKQILVLPLESGVFAKFHGRFTHVGQFLAAVHDLKNPEDLHLIKLLFMAFAPINNTRLGWFNTWNVFTEAPGDTDPISVGWWVKQFKARRIRSEPASHQ